MSLGPASPRKSTPSLLHSRSLSTVESVRALPVRRGNPTSVANTSHPLLTYLQCTKASDDAILAYHDKNLLEKLSKAPLNDIEQLKEFCQEFEDVYLNEVEISLSENLDLKAFPRGSSHWTRRD